MKMGIVKKNEIMPFAATCIDIEINIPSEPSQIEKYHMYPSYVESLKKGYKWTYLQNRNRLAELENMVTKGERWEGGINKEFEIKIYTLLNVK